ncbi:arginine--tRNA ligase [Clostridium fermenticellae]|uniref:Arginine--tRNA ligase n=1 Tax=Clostridium fermenticellae TaxID=2068654 RepID=A0A386H3W9_9CLOT|nr:arginine--tRNA ligase [Clostridium fermenticellae]AYD40380.1 arginine--tRNA ligase [Clostridium fermenticellae]
MNYKKLVAEKIKEYIDLDLGNIEKLIEIPPKSDMGDYAFPCFQLAKVLKKAPNVIASELEQKINKADFEKVTTAGPYLNFFMDKALFNKNTIEDILSEKDKYGSSKVGEGKNICVEFSSPNIAKPFHVGHLFSTSIGNSLYKILSFEGYNCVRINHLGDWGTQFGKLISAYKRWCDKEALKKEPIKELLRIYVKFHEEAEKDPSLEDEGRMYFKKLEDGAEEETKLWQEFKDLSLKEFKKLYDLLNVEFDSYAGESFYSDKMDAIIDDIDKKGLLVESNGAKVVMLDDYNIPPCIIKKSDGATIYATRDLAAATYRKKTYDFYKSLYVVGMDQSLHFRQVFTTLKLMGNKWADDCKHIGFGLVRFEDKKLSTRKGDVIFLDELLNESIEKTLEIINEKNPNLENKNEVAKKIGIGAVIFTYLKNNREKDIVFNWNDMLSFDGETGPYVQYSYARGKSILRKVNNMDSKPDYGKLNSKEEFELVKTLEGFNKAIMNSIAKLEPYIVTRYAIGVAKDFNKFYNSHNILNQEDENLKAARIKLVEATCQVLKNALGLLGIEVVEKM